MEEPAGPYDAYDEAGITTFDAVATAVEDAPELGGGVAPAAPPQAALHHPEPEHGGALEHYRPRERQLLVAADPDELIAIAERLASKLKDVITQKGLATRIGAKDHVEIGGWGVLGTLLGAFGGPTLHPEPVWHRRVVDPETDKAKLTSYHVTAKSFYSKSQGGGLKEVREYDVEGYDWECKVEVKAADGTVFGAAEAMCSRDEDKWAQSPEHAVRSMAETRASSRAYRAAVGWILELAGYASTPKEEMPDPTLPWWALEATDDKKREALANLTKVLGGNKDIAKALLVNIKERLGVTPAVLPAFIGGLVATLDAAGAGGEGSAPKPAPKPAAAAAPKPPAGLSSQVPPDEICACSHEARHHHEHGLCAFSRCPCEGFKTHRAGQQPIQPREQQQREADAPAAAAHSQATISGQEVVFDPSAGRMVPKPAAPATNGNGKPKLEPASLERTVELTNKLIEAGYSTPEADGPLLDAIIKFLGYEQLPELSDRAVGVGIELVAAAAGGNQGGVRVPQDEAVQMLEFSLKTQETRAAAVRHALKELRDWIPF